MTLVATSLLGVAAMTAPKADAVTTVPPCVVTISPNPAPVGSTVTLAITGFAANESFVATIVSNGVPIAIQTLTADATGTFSIVSVISAELADVVVVYTFVGQTNGAACSGTLTTLAAPATTTSTTSPPTTLAPTTTAPAAKAAAVTTKPAFTG